MVLIDQIIVVFNQSDHLGFLDWEWVLFKGDIKGITLAPSELFYHPYENNSFLVE